MANGSQGNPQCKICSGSKVVFYCKKDNACYYICKDCRSIFQHPLPSMSEMAEYANSQYKDGSYSDYINARELKYLHFRQRLKQFKAIFPNGRLLDVGCSCGYFMEVAMENGFDTHGIELSEVAISAAQPLTRQRIVRGSVNDLGVLQIGNFDLVTAFDILEHTEDPVKFLMQIKSILKKDGGVILSTPSTGHVLRYILRGRWPMFQPMQHTMLFSSKSLSLAMNKAGFKNIRIATAYKSVTLEYLFQQIQDYNPFIYNTFKRFKFLIPKRILVKPLEINIGEILAIAVNQ